MSGTCNSKASTAPPARWVRMGDSALKTSQLAMARYLRNPGQFPVPAGIEPRRMQIYERLVYNNIESFISGGFPVLRTLYDEEAWHTLVRAFVDQHRCHTPYFLEISQEFLQFLMQDYVLQENDPPFLAELAHYEWVELALDISEEVLPARVEVQDILAAVVRLSPLAWCLCYQFPVHRIGPAFRPVQASEPTYLVVYRDWADKVGFIELNAVTARLLELIRENTSGTAQTVLTSLAAELGQPPEQILPHGREQLGQLAAKGVIQVSIP
ncbi:Uncharacterised protein [Halioglobus japonicus]|nr:Uncharacterised protein [Halioglobus japonicus]